MERKLTEQEAENIQKERDARRTVLFKEFCREMSNLPEDFTLGMGLTNDNMKGTMEPLSNRLYQFMKSHDMMIGDIEYVKTAFEIMCGYSLNRITNISAGLVMNANLKHFGVANVIEDLTIAKLEEEGLIVLSEEDIAELSRDTNPNDSPMDSNENAPITQEDLDENPELAEAGVEVGDVGVEISDEEAKELSPAEDEEEEAA